MTDLRLYFSEIHVKQRAQNSPESERGVSHVFRKLVGGESELLRLFLPVSHFLLAGTQETADELLLDLRDYRESRATGLGLPSQCLVSSGQRQSKFGISSGWG